MDEQEWQEQGRQAWSSHARAMRESTTSMSGSKSDSSHTMTQSSKTVSGATARPRDVTSLASLDLDLERLWSGVHEEDWHVPCHELVAQLQLSIPNMDQCDRPYEVLAAMRDVGIRDVYVRLPSNWKQLAENRPMWLAEVLDALKSQARMTMRTLRVGIDFNDKWLWEHADQ